MPGAYGAQDFTGFGVAGLFDINGDNRGDVAVGSPFIGPMDDGRVFIFSGKDGAFIRTLSSPNAALQGEFGITLAPLPDVNQNGRQELIVGAPFENTPFALSTQ